MVLKCYNFYMTQSPVPFSPFGPTSPDSAYLAGHIVFTLTDLEATVIALNIESSPDWVNNIGAGVSEPTLIPELKKHGGQVEVSRMSEEGKVSYRVWWTGVLTSVLYDQMVAELDDLLTSNEVKMQGYFVRGARRNFASYPPDRTALSGGWYLGVANGQTFKIFEEPKEYALVGETFPTFNVWHKNLYSHNRAGELVRGKFDVEEWRNLRS